MQGICDFFSGVRTLDVVVAHIVCKNCGNRLAEREAGHYILWLVEKTNLPASDNVIYVVLGLAYKIGFAY